MGIIIAFAFLVGVILSFITLVVTSVIERKLLKKGEKSYGNLYTLSIILTSVVICILCYFLLPNASEGSGEPDSTIWGRRAIIAFFVGASPAIGSLIGSSKVKKRRQQDNNSN